jgi:hypothetical protein
MMLSHSTPFPEFGRALIRNVAGLLGNGGLIESQITLFRLVLGTEILLLLSTSVIFICVLFCSLVSVYNRLGIF